MESLLGSLWVCKQDTQSTVVFYVPGTVRLYPCTTSRRTGGLGTLSCLVKTVSKNSLVDMKKVLFPPLHIKLGLMKKFVKALRQKCFAVFQHLCPLFPALSSSKLKEGIYIRPQIWEVLKDKVFEELTLNEAWLLWSHMGTRLPPRVYWKFKAYENMGCWMSLKIHFFYFHLKFFLLNLRVASDEHGERFNHDITKMGRNYQDKWNLSMIGDFCLMQNT